MTTEEVRSYIKSHRKDLADNVNQYMEDHNIKLSEYPDHLKRKIIIGLAAVALLKLTKA